MAKTQVPITPAVLDWAIVESGFSRAQVAEEAGLDVRDLNDWLDAKAQPGVTEVRALAHVLRRQVATLLLPKPPGSEAPDVRFRHTPGVAARALTPAERRYVRKGARLQRLLAEIVHELDDLDIQRLPVAQLHDNPVSAAQALRSMLGVEPGEQVAWKSSSAAFDAWRDAVEQLGPVVFLFQLGKDSCRGFSLWNDHAPVVAVNTAWNDEARGFTLFHELGHLVLRASSACTTGDPSAVSDGWDPVERWCERFAASVLLPEDVLRSVVVEKIGKDAARVETVEQVRRIAARFHVSLRATTIKLIELNLTSWDLYRALPAVADAKRPGGGATGGRDRQEIQEDSLGRRTATLIRKAVDADVVTRTEALTYLDVPDSALDQLGRPS
jgi:Zn-dependent peptidase ImmA (M78 family)